jgi:hypothetical protein
MTALILLIYIEQLIHYASPCTENIDSTIFKLLYQHSDKFPMGLMPSLWKTSSCVPCQIIQWTLNSLFALYVASYFSAIFMNLFPYLIAGIITCYLPYEAFQYRMTVFSHKAKISTK